MVDRIFKVKRYDKDIYIDVAEIMAMEIRGWDEARVVFKNRYVVEVSGEQVFNLFDCWQEYLIYKEKGGMVDEGDIEKR